MSGSPIPITIDKKTQLPLYIDQRRLELQYYIPVSKIKRFFEGLEKGELWTTKCANCGTIYFPPQADCPKCRKETEWMKLSGNAELVTYTIINAKPKTFAHYQDYILAVGKLDEGIHVLSWLNAKREELKIGMKLKLIVKKREPEGYITYEFIPAQG